MSAAYIFDMSMFARSSAFALALLALCLGGRTVHAQAAPVPYANSNWFLGLSDNPAVDGSDASGGDATRANFPAGWFVANTRGSLNMNGFNRLGAFGNFGALSTDGVQFGYNFKNSPVSIYAGFDTLKYNNGAGTPFAAFDSRSSTVPG